MTMTGRYWQITLGVLALVMASHAAVAQETYELGKEGFEKVAAPAPGTPAAELQEVRRLIAADKGSRAEKAAKKWIQKHRNHPMLPEAYLLMGDAKASRGHYYRALYDYEYLLRRYPESPQFHTALERELRIAETFAGGTRRRLWGMRIMPAGGEAEELLIRIQERAPAGRVAEVAGKELGDFYFKRANMPLAAEAYGLFLANYPESQWREHAMMRRVDANLATFKGPRFDATGLLEARRRLQDFQQVYPGPAEQKGADEILVRIDESLAQKALVAARWYDKQGRKISARFMYQRVIDDYPQSSAARSAAARLMAMKPLPTAVPRQADAQTSTMGQPESEVSQ